MGLFKTVEEFEKVLVGFFELIGETPEVANKMKASDLVIRFHYSEPELVILVDCSEEEVQIRPGDCETKATIELKMKADIAHKFWFGKVNLTMALARRQMIAKGPVPKILKLLPVIKPAYKMYPNYLNQNGFNEYNIY